MLNNIISRSSQYEASYEAGLSGVRRLSDVYSGQDSRTRRRLHKMSDEHDIIMVILPTAIVSVGKGKVSVTV